MFPFAVNLSTIFTEYPFLERFFLAKQAGFSLAECQFPYSYSLEHIKKELENHKLSMVLINLPPGDWEKGDRGIAIDPERIEEFRKSVDLGITYASALNVPNIHCMAGILPPERDRRLAREIYIKNLKYAAKRLAERHLTLCIEPINQCDMPGYFLSDLGEAAKIVEEVQMPNVKLQYDFYHIQKIHGNLLSSFQRYSALIGHIQIADAPGRHEPGTGEIDYHTVFDFLKETDYSGYIGLEYIPKENSENSFNWLTALTKGG